MYHPEYKNLIKYVEAEAAETSIWKRIIGRWKHFPETWWNASCFRMSSRDDAMRVIMPTSMSLWQLDKEMESRGVG